MLMKVLDVRVTAQKPEQFINNGFEMELFGGQQREPLGQRETRLGAEDAHRACAGAVGSAFPLFKDQPEQFKILNHSAAYHLKESLDRAKLKP